MKKFSCVVLIIILLIVSQTQVFANESGKNIEIEYFEDGSYVIISIESSMGDKEFSVATTSTTATKTYKYYNADNVAQWYVAVTGTFNYGDGMSRCIRSSVSAESYSSNWEIAEKTASKSLHTAMATATAEYYINGNLKETIIREVRLSCSPTGEFS